MEVIPTPTTITQAEQKELEDIDGILPTLCKEGLLTNIECRLIESFSELLKKKGAVYTVIMAKTKAEAAALTEIFRKLSAAIHTKENSISNDENDHCVLPSRNPFMNDIIIKHLFGYLPLQDMKSCRLICRQWNSTAEICLRKRSAIRFHPDGLVPDTFIKVSKYSHPDLPFSAFIFSNDENSRWCISVIQDFLKKWEKNIKEVTFQCVSLTRISCCHSVSGDRLDLIKNYYITPLFTNTSNITCLKIKDPSNTKFEICLENFVSIKTVSLTDCRIVLRMGHHINRIAPINVNLQNISFMQNGKTLTHFRYNTLVDFSKALNINLKISDKHSTKATFDMRKQVFNANQLCFQGISLENWAQAKGCAQFVYLVGIHFLEKNQLKIKQLQILNSYIDLTALPETIEILQVAEGSNHIISSASFDMPNLKYLQIDIIDILNLAYFTHCPNFVDLVICHNENVDESVEFPLDYIPTSVKRMKMMFFPLKFTNNCIFELDSLILQDPGPNIFVTHCTTITSQIKAKVLVVVSDEVRHFDTSNILNLMLANEDPQLFLFGSYYDLYKYTPFEESDLRKYVDKKSNFYKFEHKFGKGITKDEFQKYVEMDEYSVDCFYR